MLAVKPGPVPESCLLKTYRGGAKPEAWGRYCDYFSVRIERAVTLQEFIYAFYTTPVFKLERFLIRVFAKLPSTDEQARQLAAGSLARFAAWTVAERTESQLLLADIREQTRSWLAVSVVNTGGAAQTLLQFGSGIASRPSDSGESSIGSGFKWLLRFHLLYSKVLLRSAKRRLEKS